MALLTSMPLFFRVALHIAFGVFVVAGVFYVVRPSIIQRRVLNLRRRMSERDARFVRTSWFPWVVRAAGVVLLWVGIRGLVMLGVFGG